MASLREYDDCGVATNDANDYDINIPTYFQLLQDKGYHTMSTGKDDLTKHTQLGYTIGIGTHNASDTYLQSELGFSDAIRYCGKEDVINTFPNPHEPYGYHLNSSTVTLANGTTVNAFLAHHDCIKNIINTESSLCEPSTYPQELYEDDYTKDNTITLIERAPEETP